MNEARSKKKKKKEKKKKNPDIFGELGRALTSLHHADTRFLAGKKMCY